MSSYEDVRQEVIERLTNYILERLPKKEVPLVRQFIKEYYLGVSPEDLSTRSLLDLYGAAISHWHYIYERAPNECKVRVYNPNLEEQGWQSTHTIIEIVTDDMPFLDDSISMALNRQDLNIHLIQTGAIKLKRNEKGQVTEIFDKNSKPNHWETDAAIYIEIDRQSDPAFLAKITLDIANIIEEVKVVVQGWSSMRDKTLEVLSELEKTPPPVPLEDLTEANAFLRWISDDHFTFMGYRQYVLEGKGGQEAFQGIQSTALGILKSEPEKNQPIALATLPPEGQKLIFSKNVLIIGKTNRRSTVHRPVYMDFIAIKMINANGQLSCIHFFIGLFTAVTYTGRTKLIPYLRAKVSAVLAKTGYPSKSHDERVLVNILDTLPRDDLFQASVDELLDLSLAILRLQERQRVRLFLRKDPFGYYFSCLVFVPRETFNSQLRERMQDILMKALEGTEIEFATRFTESTLARVHFIIRVNPQKSIQYDVKALEQKLVECARTWQDDLRDALLEHKGEEQGNDLYKKYQKAFPTSYQEGFLARFAVVDIDYFESLTEQKPLAMSLYRPLEEAEDIVRFKLFRIGATLPLSDVVPILENMGLRIISERPYEITPNKGPSIWINDYRMVHPYEQEFNIEAVKEIFQNAFAHVWWGEAENDGFNRLVLGAKLNWREITILRAYAKYLWQVGFTFSQDHVEDALSLNAGLANELIILFKLRFDPEREANSEAILTQKQKIEEALELVANLNEDRIIRRYMDVILATLRTNYYQKDPTGNHKPYLSFKIDSGKVPELPLPLPLYEIFVYSPRVEAIHLRGAKVARGGIRWSDRREDFRTEILGLMKAQQVKNAVIVPMGAKGGFVVKRPPDSGTRDHLMEEVVACYKIFIRGLLDITDNSKGGITVFPESVVRYDDEDPYLVVAADKGTATFSDIANELAKEYDYWLGDAFASGGSSGYDHKKMGITARGAWESVKRHFMELNFDPQTTDFTVLGIGDMSGDVFGNGMLLSKHIKLIAAFNHMHIFLDPNPDAEKSYLERERLFHLPRSSWADYNPSVISAGGGIYLRTAKFILLSPEIQQALDFHQAKVVPAELIRAILKAPLDLFWNGGIGTYVKASHESNLAVGDRANDAIRINGAELRCKVVGEGGNLGFTQLGRVEYAKLGGHLNTDAIDNSGGVNCSDNEVNIKILLHEAIEVQELTEKQRNILLAEMENEVAELVLNNNRQQTEAISVAVSQAADNLQMHGRVIQEMERVGHLDRALEFLPDKEEILARKAAHLGLTRPEVAVLMAYCKIFLKKALLNSDLPEDSCFQKELEEAFPVPLQKRYKEFMSKHRLKREIIATQLSNAVINEMSITFVVRLQDETGCSPPDIIRAYTIARSIFEAQKLHSEITALSNTVESSVQLKMLQEVNRLVRRGTRWFLRNRRNSIHNISETIQRFTPYVAEVSAELPKLLTDQDFEIESMTKTLIEAQVPEALACRIAGMSAMFSALDIVVAANTHKASVAEVAAIYYSIGNVLHLGWFRELIKQHTINNHWEALARASFRDDLDRQQRNLTINIMHHNGGDLNEPKAMIDLWLKKYQALVTRWEYFITELKNTPETDFTMFAVALRELHDMVQASVRKVKSH